MSTSKTYSLSPLRTKFIGMILLLVGFTAIFMGIDLNNSLWINFQTLFIDFRAIDSFLFSFVKLFFEGVLLAGGFLYLKYAANIIRAKMGSKGFYFAEIPTGNKYDRIAMDLNPLTFIPYAEITDITYHDNLFSGGQIELFISGKPIRLTALGALKDDEKREIVEIVKSKILL